MNKILTSENDTSAFARNFAKDIKHGDVILLRGDLGTGKTVFARSLIRELCASPDLDVPSPTFTLVQMYEAAIGTLWHFDLYRLEKPDDVYELGWEEALSDGICLIEWPEKLGSLCPPASITIDIQHIKDWPEARKITITTGSAGNE